MIIILICVSLLLVHSTLISFKLMKVGRWSWDLCFL